jgi:hypothetical protein
LALLFVDALPAVTLVRLEVSAACHGFHVVARFISRFSIMSEEIEFWGFMSKTMIFLGI